MSQPTDEQIARLMAASPDIRPLCIEQAANQVDVIAAMARTWIMNGDDQHGAALQNLCIAFGFQRTEIERLRVENANLRARRNDVRDWAMRNEIAAPPLDWAGLGRILDNPSDLAAPVPVDQPKPTKTAAELIRDVAERDPEAHAAALGRAYGVDRDPSHYPDPIEFDPTLLSPISTRNPFRVDQPKCEHGETEAHSIWRCEDCGWPWPFPGGAPVGAECDSCGGDLERVDCPGPGVHGEEQR